MTARELRASRYTEQARRTYLCLEGTRKKPTDYQVTSTGLLYHPTRGFEIETPASRHYEQHRLRGNTPDAAWDEFEDPAQLTYSAYVAERRDQEAFLARLFERPSLPVTPALEPLLGLLSAFRFPLHGLQMTAAYLGALAPSGRVATALAFQAADELRRVQLLCRWLVRSSRGTAELDARGRELWQAAPAFQPLRELIERLLVTYHWGEALLTLNGVLKPLLEGLWFEQVASLAERYGDEVLEKSLSSLGDDGRWHQTWFGELSRKTLSTDGDARLVVDRARPLALQALRALLPAFEGLFADEGTRAYVINQLDAGLLAHLERAGLRVPTQEGSDERGS